MSTTQAMDAARGAARWLRRNRIWLLVLFAYVSVFPYSPGINNPNENVRVYMTRALVEHHELGINKVEAEWGWVNDKAKIGARLFSSKAPGTSLLGVPVLAVQTGLWHLLGWRSPSQLATTLALRLFAVMLPMCGFLWAFWRHARRLSGQQGIADLLLIAVALGSLLYPYGIHFVGHGLAAALSFGAFMVLAPQGTITDSHRRAALGGLFAGLGVVFEYQNLLVAALLTIYVAARRPRLLPSFLLGALPAVAILGVVHTLCFGRPWAFPYGHLENLDYQSQHMRGFHGAGLPSLTALVGVFFLPGFGFFACSPFLAVALLATGFLVVRGPRAEGLLCAAVLVVLGVFLAGIPNWRGGWSVGPRYIAATVPFLVVTLAYAWPRVARARLGHLAWSITAGLILAGVFVNALAAVIYPQYPPQLKNPAFQLLIRLPFEGFVPYSFGYAVGLKGLLSLLPTVAAIGAAVGLALASARRRDDGEMLGETIGGIARGNDHGWGRRSAIPLALIVFLAFVVPFSLWSRKLLPAERDAVRLVKSTWTPAAKPALLPAGRPVN